jgi:hypothetical protein
LQAVEGGRFDRDLMYHSWQFDFRRGRGLDRATRYEQTLLGQYLG